MRLEAAGVSLGGGEEGWGGGGRGGHTCVGGTVG